MQIIKASFLILVLALAGQAQNPQAPPSVTYSRFYEVRADIHKYASYATLPLFGSEVVLGQYLYNHPESSGVKGAHTAVGTTTVGLFVANSVTGVWNLWEGRHDTRFRKKRVAHSVLMLAANAGFVATAATGPSSRDPDFNSGKATHRNIAIASFGVGTAGYLLMLFGRH
jgi:hypothetical protein